MVRMEPLTDPLDPAELVESLRALARVVLVRHAADDTTAPFADPDASVRLAERWVLLDRALSQGGPAPPGWDLAAPDPPGLAVPTGPDPPALDAEVLAAVTALVDGHRRVGTARRVLTRYVRDRGAEL